MLRQSFAMLLLAQIATGAEAQHVVIERSTPAPAAEYQIIAERFGKYDIVLRPDESRPEWWAGAPSVVRDDEGTFWLAARMRTSESERGLRGYEIRILRSSDGVSFEKVLSIRREDVPIPGFERPALVYHDTRYTLYACGPWQGGPWGIIRFDPVSSPDRIDPTTAKLVLAPAKKSYDRDVSPVEYKDPFILFANGRFHCYVTGYMRRNERIYHFESDDGEDWTPVGDGYTSLLPLAGWHDFFVRPGCVVPLGIGYLFVYEGSRSDWYDPVYNLATGIGFTFDLHTVTDLTPDAPLLVSGTPGPEFSTFRYSHWMMVDDEMWVYAEVAAADATNELRLYRIRMD